jgi:hypothetical protein
MERRSMNQTEFKKMVSGIKAKMQNLTKGQGAALETAQALREHVLSVCQIGEEGDPLNEDGLKRETGRIWCHAVWEFLYKQEWFLPARSILRELWELHAEYQRSSPKRRVYRAHLGQLLTETVYRVGNVAEAFRWSMLTQADNILGGDPERGRFSRHWLYAKFGLTDAEREALDALAEKCKSEAETKGWNSSSGFAEEVLRRFAQSNKNGRDVFQRLSGTEEFHLTRSYLRVLLDRMTHASKSQKGKRLEDVAFYLFSLLPGCVLRRNIEDRAKASEYDLVVSNMAPTSSLLGDIFGRDFIIECKNWNNTVGAEQVGYFLFRMGLTHCRFGVIVARKNITGKPTGDAYAEALVRRAFHEHGSACVVVSMTDLEDLASGQVSGLTSLLIERLNDFRFGKGRRLA